MFRLAFKLAAKNRQIMMAFCFLVRNANHSLAEVQREVTRKKFKFYE